MFFGANLNVGVCSEFLLLVGILSSIKSTSCWLGDHGGSLISASRETSVNFQQTREGMIAGPDSIHLPFIHPKPPYSIPDSAVVLSCRPHPK